jgi:hypothetical protein
VENPLADCRSSDARLLTSPSVGHRGHHHSTRSPTPKHLSAACRHDRGHRSQRPTPAEASAARRRRAPKRAAARFTRLLEVSPSADPRRSALLSSGMASSAITQSGLQGFEQSAESVSNGRSVTRARRPSLSWPCAPPGFALAVSMVGFFPLSFHAPRSPKGPTRDRLGESLCSATPEGTTQLERPTPHTIFSRGLSRTATRRHPCTGSPEF